MVGLLSGMENSDQVTVMIKSSDSEGELQQVKPTDSEGKRQQDLNSSEKCEGVKDDAKQPEEVISDAPNVDTANEVGVNEAKELKSILKRRGQYTMRKVKVDFDLIPKSIPYDETKDYTVDIIIVEKEPVKIKSWAAIFAAKKAEAEAEAAAIAEADAALKKAEEAKRKKASKVKAVRNVSVMKNEDGVSSMACERPNADVDGLTNSKDVVAASGNYTKSIADNSEIIQPLENEDQDHLHVKAKDATEDKSLVEKRINGIDSETPESAGSRPDIPEEVFEAAVELVKDVIAETPVILSRAVSVDEDFDCGPDIIGESQRELAGDDPEIKSSMKDEPIENSDENGQNPTEPVQCIESLEENESVEGMKEFTLIGSNEGISARRRILAVRDKTDNERDFSAKVNESLIEASPEIIDTAVDILNEIEKVTLAVVANVETAFP